MREQRAEVFINIQAAAPSAPATEESPTLRVPAEPLGVCIARRSVRFRQARVELLLVPGGRLRRYVVLETPRLRALLGQPRRREIASLSARQQHFELSTSELWALGEHQANASLRLLYARIDEVETSENKITEKRRRVAKPLGKVLAPMSSDGSVLGELLYAGPTETELFCVELLEDGRHVRSIAHPDLARALLAANAQVGDTIHVERAGQHEVSIREERSGSHGEGKQTLRQRRETFRITKHSPLEADSGRAPSNGTLRSASSTS